MHVQPMQSFTLAGQGIAGPGGAKAKWVEDSLSDDEKTAPARPDARPSVLQRSASGPLALAVGKPTNNDLSQANTVS